MKSFLPKSSTLLFFIISIFLVFNFFSYKLLLTNLKDNHSKNQEISFYLIQRETSNLLTKLLYKYSQEKDLLLKKHEVVLNYLKTHSYDDSLEEIYEILNKDLPLKPYNIYITDKDLVIRNTTFKPDLNFDLSFAKPLFDNHKNKQIIGISPPIFETFSLKFFSFSDSYLPKEEGKLLQISFTYEELNKDLENLQTLINANKYIKSSNAYIVFNDGYIGDFIFKSLKSYKPSLEEVKQRLEQGKLLSKDINENSYISTYFTKDNSEYKVTYFSQKSPIFDESNVIYSVVFDEDDYLKDIFKLNMAIFLLSLIGVITIYIIYRVRFRENLLRYKDKFIEHSVHEIKTPLSVLILNSQLRNKTFGEDKYSKKIEGALKTLENSYDDMTFLHTKDKINYIIEKLSLKNVLSNRIKYFQVIADSQNRRFDLQISNDIFIELSQIELNRLIDNNLSNALKYSNIASTIKIIVSNNTLEFHSIGNAIIDTNNIFKKYSRENESVGGHGLGLSIVNDICAKYKISINVQSLNDNTNIFSYKFNCHTVDTK